MDAINKLPDEVLLMIFQQVLAKDLRKLMQTNKRFRELICNSKALMWKLPLLLEQNWKKQNKIILNFQQKFQKVIITDIVNWNKHMLKIFKKNGSHVSELEFKRCNFDESTWLVQILKLLPNLETLKFYSTDVIESDEEDDHDSVSLPKLNFVRVIDTSLELFKFLKSCNIDCLKIKCSAMDHYEVNPFIQFIKNQKKLKVLALKGLTINNSDFFQTDISKDLQFRLRVLSLEHLYFETNPLDVNLLNFLKSQPDIEEIEIGKLFHQTVFMTIFQDMKRLKTISIRGDSLTEVFTENVIPNLSIHQLIIRGEIKNSSVLKNVINLMPNLITLKFIAGDLLSQETLLYIANNLEKLENLVLCKCSNRNFSSVKFSNLKNLQFEWADSIEFSGWKQITNNNPNIETLAIRWGKDLKNKTINLIVKNLTKLKHLKIGTGFSATKSVFHNIARINKNLKVVEILKDNLTSYKTPIKDLITFCHKMGITLKVYDSLLDIFKEEHSEWLEEMHDYYDLESSDLTETDSDESINDFDTDEDEYEDERIYVGHGLNINLRNFIDFINVVNPGVGADFMMDSDDDSDELFENPFGLNGEEYLRLRQLVSDSEDEEDA